MLVRASDLIGWLAVEFELACLLKEFDRCMAGRVLALPLAHLPRLSSGDHLRDLRHHQGLAWYQLGIGQGES